MRIRSLYIGDFKNLQDFSVRFSDENRSWISVVLGWNGTGKSNLIESLVILFKELDLGKPEVDPNFRTTGANFLGGFPGSRSLAGVDGPWGAIA